MRNLNTVKIENHPEFVRDMNSQAIINTDVTALQAYKARHSKLKEARQETLDTKKRIESLEKELSILRSIVGELATLRNRA